MGDISGVLCDVGGFIGDNDISASGVCVCCVVVWMLGVIGVSVVVHDGDAFRP